MQYMELALLPSDVWSAVFSYLPVRDVLSLACTNKGLHATCQDDMLWKEMAERKWGQRVRELARPADTWQAWCRHRMAHVSLPRSPLDLVQEHYLDPWQHLATCLLCSRTTAGQAVRAAIDAFLAAYPTPSALLDAPEAEVLAIMHPLGLQAVRYAALVSTSRDFLATDWENPSVFKGCGKFTCDSWRIFCRGHRELRGVEDVNLCRFLRWLNRGELPSSKAEVRQRQGGSRKRRAEERPAEAGTLRSGRLRGDRQDGSLTGGRRSSASALGRRQTRSMAAAVAGVTRSC